MDDDWLTRGMRGFVADCVREAAHRGTTTVEAEHVLLALAADGSAPASRILSDAGLTYDAIGVALREERMRSLAAAGIAPIDAQLLPATPRKSKPAWGASVVAARARQRGGSGALDRRRSPEIDVLIGILRAPVGTVPRALTMAGIDRPALVTRLEQLAAT